MKWFKRKHKEEMAAPTYMQYLKQIDLCSKEVQEEYFDILKHQPRPDTLCGRKVPVNLNCLSYGQLDDLRDASSKKNDIELAIALTKAVFEEELNLFDEDVNKVFGFVLFCTAELKRINELFLQLKPSYTSEEKAAGVEKLDFGSFGVLDWYAKRMGITNQNDVRSVAWVRIFQCMKNDHLQQQFERKLHDVYMRKSNTGTRKR